MKHTAEMMEQGEDERKTLIILLIMITSYYQ